MYAQSHAVHWTGVRQFPPGQFPLPFWVGHFPRTIPPIYYAYIHIHLYVCMRVYYVCMYVYNTCMCKYAKIYQYMYVCMYVLYAYIRVCMHLCVYACMYICMHVCIHVSINQSKFI